MGPVNNYVAQDTSFTLPTGTFWTWRDGLKRTGLSRAMRGNQSVAVAERLACSMRMRWLSGVVSARAIIATGVYTSVLEQAFVGRNLLVDFRRGTVVKCAVLGGGRRARMSDEGVMSDWQPVPYKDYRWIVAAPRLLGGKLAIRGTSLRSR